MRVTRLTQPLGDMMCEINLSVVRTLLHIPRNMHTIRTFVYYITGIEAIFDCRSTREVALKNMDHDDVIKWKHFPRYWPFVRGIYRSSMNSPHKGQWRGALMFSLIGARIDGWVNNGEAGDLRSHRAHYDVMVMWMIYEFIKNDKHNKTMYMRYMIYCNNA